MGGPAAIVGNGKSISPRFHSTAHSQQSGHPQSKRILPHPQRCTCSILTILLNAWLTDGYCFSATSLTTLTRNPPGRSSTTHTICASTPLPPLYLPLNKRTNSPFSQPQAFASHFLTPPRIVDLRLDFSTQNSLLCTTRVRELEANIVLKRPLAYSGFDRLPPPPAWGQHYWRVGRNREEIR